MSPEQASGQPAGPASDQFAFGAILYELLTGRQAFHGESRDSRRSRRSSTAEPRPIETLNPHVPRLASTDRRAVPGEAARRRGSRTSGISSRRFGTSATDVSRRPTRRQFFWIGAGTAAAADRRHGDVDALAATDASRPAVCQPRQERLGRAPMSWPDAEH